MKYVDFVGQTLIIAFAITLPFLVTPNEKIITFLSVQFLLGAWQMISCFVSLFTDSAVYKQKQRHFTLSLVYLFLLFVAKTTGLGSDGLSSELILAALIGPPWILGIYYYLITARITFTGSGKSSSFLPHINF